MKDNTSIINELGCLTYVLEAVNKTGDRDATKTILTKILEKVAEL
jgi:hypothetical protein